MKRSFYAGYVVFILLLYVSRSDAGSSYFGFIEEPVHSLATGMGSTGTSTGEGGFPFYNPAGLSIAGKSFITFDFARIMDDLGRGYVETGWIFPTWFFGGSFQTQEDEFPRTDITGILPNAYGNDRGTQASLLVGIKRDWYAFGITLNGVHDVIGEYKAYGFSGSAGTIVTIIPDHIYAGFSAINAAGRHTRFMNERNGLKSERFPVLVRGGISWKDTLLQSFPLTLSTDVVYNYNDRLVTVPVGIDVNLLPPINIRIGKRFNHPSDLFSIGVGLAWKNIEFNAAFIPIKYVTDIFVKRSVSLTYSLALPEKPQSTRNSENVESRETNKSVMVPSDFITDSSLAKSEKHPADSSTVVDSIVISDIKDTLTSVGILPDTPSADSAVIDSASTQSAVIQKSARDSSSLERSVSTGTENEDFSKAANVKEDSTQAPSPSVDSAQQKSQKVPIVVPTAQDSLGKDMKQ